ncbi:MAG: GldG family protein [Planctomycetes bacterium]|nr:GldG family protein [Planctomycetota bacterium]
MKLAAALFSILFVLGSSKVFAQGAEPLTWNAIEGAILRSLEHECAITVFSEELNDEFREQMARVRDLAESLRQLNPDNVTVNFIDLTVEDENDQARIEEVDEIVRQYSVPEITYIHASRRRRISATLYCGIVVESPEFPDSKAPLHIPFDEETAEVDTDELKKDIVRTIFRANTQEPPMVAVATPNSVYESWTRATARFDVLREFDVDLNKCVETISVDLSTLDSIGVLQDPRCEVLIVLQPVDCDFRRLGPRIIGQEPTTGSVNDIARFLIDQFLISGKTVIVVGHKFDLFQQESETSWSLKSLDIGISEQLEHYGLDLHQNIVVESPESCRTIPMRTRSGLGTPVEDVSLGFYLSLGESAFLVNGESVDLDFVTRGMDEFSCYYVSSIDSLIPEGDKKRIFKPLISSTEGSYALKGENILLDALDEPPEGVERRRHHVIAGVEGRFRSFFKAAPVDIGLGDSFEFLSATTRGKSGRVVLLASTYLTVQEDGLSIMQNIVDEQVFGKFVRDIDTSDESD